MSNTRTAPPGAEPSNTARLASSKLMGIKVGLNIVAQVARVRSDDERAAMLWLTNYAHLQDLTADALGEELDMEKAEIRRALTDPDADLSRFVRQVEALRAKFEAAIPKLANTKVKRKIANAVKFATSGTPQIVEIVGKTRMGKTDSARAEYLKRLDHAVWLHCPSASTEKDFLNALGRACGIGVGSTGLKNTQLRPKIEGCFGARRMRLLFVDEGHRLWPTDLKSQPSRIEFLRDLWELHGVSVIILATPQYSEALASAMESNPRWSPGQWDGRVQRSHLADTMDRADLEAVARHHAPGFGDELIAKLVEQAESSEGFCGVMVKAIQRVNFMAAEQERPVDLKMLETAQAELARGTRLEQLAKSGGRKVVTLRRAA